MGIWQLLLNDEAVDTVDLKTESYEEAHTYFRLRKHLDAKSFYKLFVVKKYKRKQKPVGPIEWWKDTNTNLDDF
jgi:hypothetical protein